MAEQNAKRGGGPKTPEGKERSSQNSLQHGARSSQLRLLPNESQTEFDEMVAGWNEQFQPSDYEERRMVEVLIQTDWMLRRNQRSLSNAEYDIFERAKTDDSSQWTDEQRRRRELAMRYKTSAERSFSRALKALQTLYKEKRRMEDQVRRVEMQVVETAQKLAVTLMQSGRVEAAVKLVKQVMKSDWDGMLAEDVWGFEEKGD